MLGNMRVLRGRETVWRSVLACPEGLEPPTYCLEGNCSIQLSYGQTNGAHNKVRIILRACIRETLSVLLCRGVMGAWLRILAV